MATIPANASGFVEALARSALRALLDELEAASSVELSGVIKTACIWLPVPQPPLEMGTITSSPPYHDACRACTMVADPPG
mmetsp:Transcript_34272/g.68257  ORF Transcript_34272/g.68257 Transcript_34272/m.68257 type:complete len:80 (-) Transcript_34272:201-440(-)